MMPFSLKEIIASFAPMSRPDRVRRVLECTCRIFAADGDDKLLPKMVKYRLGIEPTTGLTRQILIARAMMDLKDNDGLILTKIISMGPAYSLAAFSEHEIKEETGSFFALTIILNQDARTFHLGGDEFSSSETDAFAIAESLVKATVALETHRKEGDTYRILPKKFATPEILARVRP